jgi:hypothetical protein
MNMATRKKCVRILCMKLLGKRPFERLRNVRKNEIKIDHLSFFFSHSVVHHIVNFYTTIVYKPILKLLIFGLLYLHQTAG